jgi:hypothetical protein
MDAREEFDRIFGDVVMSDNDAAWYIFKAGWNAARQAGQYDHPFQCRCESCKEKLARMTNRSEARAWRKRQVKEIED